MLLGFYVCSAAVHILVVAKVIPFDWIGGGRSESYRDQLAQSVVSLMILALLAVFVVKLTRRSGKMSSGQRIALNVLIGFWTLGLILQLVGTNFERYVLSVLLAEGVLSHWLFRRQDAASAERSGASDLSVS